MPPRKRRSYTAEYKVEAAHRVIDTDRTIAEVARELGIDAGMFDNWVKDERRRIAAAEVHGEKSLEPAERAELLRLRRQVAELEKDNVFPGKSFGVLCRDARRIRTVRSDGEVRRPRRQRRDHWHHLARGHVFLRPAYGSAVGSQSGYYAYVKRAAATVLTVCSSVALI